MPRTFPYQSSFNGGEFGPLLLGRSDFTKYRSATRKSENLIMMATGGAARRGGSRFVAPVKTPDDKDRLIPFEFSTEQAYMIEAGDEYFRFYRNQGQIVTQNVTGVVTNGTFDANITGWTDLSAGTGSIAWNPLQRMDLIAGDAAANLAHAEQEITNAAAVEYTIQFRLYGLAGETVKLRVGTATGLGDIVDDREFGVGFYSFTFTPTAANFFIGFVHEVALASTISIDDIAFLDNQPLELATLYQTADLPDLRWAQSADVLYLAHKLYPTYKLLRFGTASFGLEEVEWLDGPYLAVNGTETTLTAAALTGNDIDVTASAVEGINDGQGFLATDVGRLLRLSDGTEVGYAVIASITSTLIVKVDIQRDFPVTTAQTDWRLGAWSETTGYPQTIQFHEQRLLMSNTPRDPDKIWFSQTGDFENMRIDSPKESGGGVEVQDDDALDYRISSDQVNAVQWMRSGTRLMIGTRGGEWIASSDGSILTPTDIDIKQQTRIGSAFVDPKQVDNAVLFLQRGQREIREYAFNFEADGFRSPEMTILNKIITKTRISEMGWAQAPHSLMLGVRGDGRIAALTYKREQDVVGWGRWLMGGAFDSGIAVIESVATIPGTDGAGQVQDSTERDEIWVIVKRTIDGGTKRYVEFFEDVFEGPDRNEYLTEADYETALLAQQLNMYYSDSLITYDGVPASVIDGLDHLEGQTVKVLGDGAVLQDEVVSGGSISLQAPVSIAQVGLGYFHDVETLKLDFGNPAGSAIGEDKVIRDADLVLHETGSLVIGPTRDELKTRTLRESSDLMDTAVPLFTGQYDASVSSDYIVDPRMIIRDDAPTAFTILGSVADLQTAAGQ